MVGIEKGPSTELEFGTTLVKEGAWATGIRKKKVVIVLIASIGHLMACEGPPTPVVVCF